MLSLIGIAVLGGQVYGDRTPNIREEIQNTYAGYARAVLRRNIDDTMSYLTPDIVWVQRGRRNDREQIRKSNCAQSARTAAQEHPATLNTLKFGERHLIPL